MDSTWWRPASLPVILGCLPRHHSLVSPTQAQHARSSKLTLVRSLLVPHAIIYWTHHPTGGHVRGTRSVIINYLPDFYLLAAVSAIDLGFLKHLLVVYCLPFSPRTQIYHVKMLQEIVLPSPAE